MLLGEKDAHERQELNKLQVLYKQCVQITFQGSEVA